MERCAIERLTFFATLLFITLWTFNSVSESRTSHWACEMRAFATGNSYQQLKFTPELSGQGLVNCRNVAGFTFDIPVRFGLRIVRSLATTATSQLKISMHSEPFVIPRNPNLIYGTYERQGEALIMRLLREGDFMLKSKETGLLIPVHLSIPDESRGDWTIDSLQLDFDESAPALTHI